MMKTVHKIIAWLSIATLLMVALGVGVSFWAFRQVRETADARKHTFIVLNGADDLLSALKDAETSMRGYLLTGDEAFLEPYLEMRDRIRGQLEKLRQLTLIDAACKHLDAMVPLVDASLVHISNAIELYRKHDVAAAVDLVRSGAGKRLMDTIRAEIKSYIRIEEGALAQHDAEFQSDMRRMFILIAIASLFTLILALSFAYLIYRESQQRLKDLVHLETRHLLKIQEETNKQLQQANFTLQVSEEKLAVTLNSIGDAVIATDAEGRVILLNPLAEKLTGWTHAEAACCPIDNIFHIINQETRLPAIFPIMETLAHGTIHALSNHTILIARDGSERVIDDSCAPIRNSAGHVVGAVLVFRDVTERRQAEKTLEVNEEQLKIMFNEAPIGIALIDSVTGHVYEMNHMFAKIAGRTLEQMANIDWMSITHPDDVQKDLDNMALLNSGKIQGFRIEKRYLRPDGTAVWINMTITPLKVKDRVQPRHICMIDDISEHKRLEKALEELEATKKSADEASEFAESVINTVREPL
ncbi:MAG: PAS domain S-box protein, partial [Lentisphaerota bacterium]